MPTNSDYAKIAIACKDLGLDRKVLIADRYGVESAKDLKPQQLFDLFKYFRAQGWQPRPTSKKQKYPKSYQRKVQAMWITMAKKGVIESSSDASMNKWIKKMVRRDSLRFCEYALCSILIEALKSWGDRNGVHFD